MSTSHDRAGSDAALDEYEEVALLDSPAVEPNGKQRPSGSMLQTFFMGKSGFRPVADHDGATEDSSLQAGKRPFVSCEVAAASAASSRSREAGAETSGRRSPEVGLPFYSRLFFLYVNPLMKLGASKHLDEDDLWDLAPWNEAQTLHAQYEVQLQKTSSSKFPHGSVWTALVRAFGPGWAAAGLLKLVHDLVNLTSPRILQQLLLHMQEDGHHWGSVRWAFVLFLFGCAVPLLINQYFILVFNVGLRVKTALIQALYAKSLRISMAAKNELGQGAVANLQSNDAGKLWNLPQYGHVIWSGPLQVLIIIYSLHNIIGWQAALAGLATTVLLVPLNTVIGKVVAKLRKELVKKTDARVKIVSEVINGVKAIKLYAWEEPYMERLARARADERAAIRKTQLLSCVNSVMFLSGPILVAIAAFGTFVALGNEVTAAVAFPALAYFDLLRFPIIMLPMQVMNFINARVALRRLQAFVNSAEVPDTPPLPPTSDPGESAIVVENGSFGWNVRDAALLRDVRLHVPHGSLVVVVGPVGCGKSSLLAALLSEMPRLSGSVVVRGSVAYTAQDPWIQNDTVEGNIRMGLDMDERRYEACISACALTADLDMLPGGDQTEIGEKGVNLSGGQKHRIALARACYAGADVYLFDDPLSAVDAHVGRHLMSQCICGMLAASTRVLVTHQLQFLPEADIVVKMEPGHISHIGTYTDLVAQGVSFAEFKLTDERAGSDAGGAAEAEEDDTGGGAAVPVIGAVKADQNGAAGAAASAAPADAVKRRQAVKAGALTGKEDRSKGSVSRAVYRTYLAAWGPGLVLPIAFLTVAVCERGLQVTQNYWLTVWSAATLAWDASDDKEGSFPTTFYMAVYFGFGLVSISCQFTRAVTLVFSTLQASQVLHDALLRKIMSLPMSFFDTQPSGRLLNRFTKDVENCDINMQQTISSVTTCIVSVLMSVLVVVAVTRGAVVAALVPLFFLYRSVQRYYLATSRELKRLDSVALSPIFSNFGETLAGLITVRAFGRQASFLRKNERLMNGSNRVWWPIQNVNRWLSVRLELMGQCIVLAAAIFASLFIKDAGLAGLALTAALSLVSLMSWATRQSTELELGMNSVERMVEYDSYESEAPAVIPENRPAAFWPAQGAIEITDLVVRYRPELPPVLKGVSVRVASHEKVGICGRTGCGKSTLMLALYRIVEPTSGSIRIDGVEATQIGLRDLRSRLSLVPQDPVIFSGTVRDNLDPFATTSDLNMWQALDQAGLAATLKRMDAGLDTVLEEGGSNLSVGQRQLLCMSRALLKRSTILLMDEATSNVDNETDSLIQRTIRTAFQDCTVLTIAHRLHTIIDSDKILMLDAGEVAEFGAPSELLQNVASPFRRLVTDASTAKTGNSSGLQMSKSSMALAAQLGIQE